MTLPNVLTLSRCLAVLAIAALLVVPGTGTRAAVLVLFTLAALTDWLDGWIARTFDMMSDLGRVLDIIADKLLVGVTLVMLCADGTVAGVHALAAALILAREIGISGLREHLAGRAIVIPASLAGKWKTAAQLVALAVLIAAPLRPAGGATEIAGLALLWCAAALTVWSGVQYVWGTRGAWGKA
jgi:CDP-diacylglycerol--glycerol-3-phosphate 3-phosphatidyltransferase